MSEVAVEKITLLWTCPECEEKVRQPLPEIGDSGPAFCAECERHMELNDLAEVDS